MENETQLMTVDHRQHTKDAGMEMLKEALDLLGSEQRKVIKFGSDNQHTWAMFETLTVQVSPRVKIDITIERGK